MKVIFDPAKDAINTAKHGCSLNDAAAFEWDTAVVWLDERFDYDEVRMSGIGYIGMRLYYIAYTERDDAIRVISLRKATSGEVKRYAET